MFAQGSRSILGRRDPRRRTWGRSHAGMTTTTGTDSHLE